MHLIDCARSTFRRFALLVGVVLLTGCEKVETPEHKAWRDNVEAGQALWEQKCKTDAGVKIYRRVEDVEGLVLLKIRPQAWENEWHDPMWPGAAFAREVTGDSYIESFLGYEHSSDGEGKKPVSSTYRGYINTSYLEDNPSNEPGYRYVDVIEEHVGKRYRYSGSVKVVGKKDTSAPGVQIQLAKEPSMDLNVYRWTLDRIPTNESAPRYAVTYEDHVVPEERALGVASSTIKVLDLETQEVLAEATVYAHAYNFAVSDNPAWLRAKICPVLSGGPSKTRVFVDQILIPRKEK